MLAILNARGLFKNKITFMNDVQVIIENDQDTAFTNRVQISGEVREIEYRFTTSKDEEWTWFIYFLLLKKA